MDAYQSFPLGTQQFSGYTSDPSNAQQDYVSAPCENMLVTDDGRVEQRTGYENVFTLATSGETTAFYHSTYDIAFLAVGTKLYYRDFATDTTYDTGITLTTGTKTRFAEYFGDIYLTNTTDGITRLCVGRVNDSAANSGDSTFTVDVSFLGRMTAFGDTTGIDFVINGTTENVASFAVSTGVCTHTTTLSQNYADNSIVLFVDAYAGLEDASKILFWKSRMHIMGFPNATNVDQPNNSVLAGQFVLNNANELEKIVDFTFGTGGSTRISVGGGGSVTNILGVADNIYFFTENKVFSTASTQIPTSGSAVGLTIPDEKDSLHGCINEDCATVTGNSALTYITTDRRIMSIPIDTETGAAIAAPEEDYDVDVRDHLKNMSEDQTGAFAYHYRGGRQTIYQVKLAGQWRWLIRDHNIIRRMGSNFVRGAWQPPQSIGYFVSLFERNGVLYGTDDQGMVHSIFTTFSDNLSPIYAIFATGEFNVGNAYTKNALLKGTINEPSQINIKCYVTNENGKRSGSAKVINGADYTYAEDYSVGAVPVGSGGVGDSTPIADWRKEFGVFPSQGSTVQLVAENYQDGGYFSIKSYQLEGTQNPHTSSARL